MPDSNHAPGNAATPPHRAPRPRLNFGWSWLWGPLALALGLLCLVVYGRMSGLFLLAQRQQAELAARQRQTQAALAQGARFRAAAALMAAPETRSVSVRAALGATGARAYFNPARGAALVVSALPPAGAGRAYELWVLPAQGDPRPAGTFQPDAGGTAVAVVAGPLGDGAGLAVSPEPSSGSPRPSGAMLLTARPPKP
jgi:Anti-sigma-K factor rskA, C-terminal